jgi:RIO-like serine/threonine protein kinase
MNDKMNEMNKINNIFKSKRNKVWLENNRVCKLIANPGAAQAEAEILRRLFTAGVKVPRVLSLDLDLSDSDNNMLILEYIKGISVTDEIERAEKEQGSLPVQELAEKLTHWFAAFYAVFSRKIRGDVNLRNFILTPDFQIYGVDFEEFEDSEDSENCEDSPCGQKERDLGRMTAFILNYDPPYTDYKKKLAQAVTDCFTASFDIEHSLVLQEHEREIEAMRKRRNKK